MTELTIEQATDLPTHRLLAYYKKYGHSWVGKYYCASCGDFLCEYGFDAQARVRYSKEYKYWSEIKQLLSTREHIHKNNEVNSSKKH